MEGVIDSKEAAIRKINEIARTAKETEGRVAKNEDAVKDLTDAVKILGERPAPDVTTTFQGEQELRSYVTDESKGLKGIRLKAHSEEDGHVEFGLLDDPKPKCEWQAKFQELAEMRSWLWLCGKPVSRSNPGGDTSRADRLIARHIANAPTPIKRVFTDASNYGAELIPDVTLPQLERMLSVPRVVAGLFQEVQMSGNTMKLPFLARGLRPYKKGALSGSDNNPAQYTASDIDLDEREIAAVGMAVRALIDEDADQDSIIAAIPLLQQLILEALQDGEEDALINSDTAATHQDTGLANWDIRGRWGTSGLGGSDDHRRTILGLRAQAIDRSCTTDGSGAQTFAGVMTSRLAMDAPHGVLGDVVMITSPEWYLNKICQMTEHLTVDKFGPAAFNVTGFVSAIGGMPIFLSEFVDKQYNASGVYDNSTKTKTGYVIVNRARYKRYVRKANTVEIAKDITRGVINLVATRRGTLKTFDADATKNVNWTYNLSPS